MLEQLSLEYDSYSTRNLSPIRSRSQERLNPLPPITIDQVSFTRMQSTTYFTLDETDLDSDRSRVYIYAPIYVSNLI
jgi:hypothetical protein